MTQIAASSGQQIPIYPLTSWLPPLKGEKARIEREGKRRKGKRKDREKEERGRERDKAVDISWIIIYIAGYMYLYTSDIASCMQSLSIMTKGIQTQQNGHACMGYVLSDQLRALILCMIE